MIGISERELSPELLKRIGLGSVQEKKDVSKIIGPSETRRVRIPKEDFNKDLHKFILCIGSTVIHEHRYRIEDNFVVLNEGEEDFEPGRRLNFIFFYTTNIPNLEGIKSVNGSIIEDGTINVSKFNEPVKSTINDLIDGYDVKPTDVVVHGKSLVNLFGHHGSGIYRQRFEVVSDDIPQLEYSGTKIVAKGLKKEQYYHFPIRRKELKSNTWYFAFMRFSDSNESLAYKYYPIAANSGITFDDHSYFIDHQNGYASCLHKFNESSDGDRLVYIMGRPYASTIPQDASGDFSAWDIRLYELTEEEAAKVKSLGSSNNFEELNKLYPYVDNHKAVVNPYVQCKENLLEDVVVCQGKTLADGSLQWNIDESQIVINCKHVKVEPNTTYTINRDNIPKKYQVKMQGIGLTDMESDSFNTGENKILNLVITCVSVDDAKELVENINTKKWTISLVKGTTAKKAEDCHSSRISFNTTLYEGEKIYRRFDGKYVKNSIWGEIDIFNESSPIRITNNAPGFKITEVRDLKIPFVKGDGCYLVRYDGRLVKYEEESTANKEKFYIHGSEGRGIVLVLPNYLTGWGDEYTPNSREINAFFLGWKMYDVDISTKDYDMDILDPETLCLQYNDKSMEHKKGWVRLFSSTNHDICLKSKDGVDIIWGKDHILYNIPTMLNTYGYNPYKLIYKKSIPTEMIVTTQGDLLVKEGIDVTASSGLIINEQALTHLSLDNNIHTNGDKTNFKNRCGEVLSVRTVDSNILPFKHVFFDNDTDYISVYGFSQPQFIGNNKIISTNEPLCVDYVLPYMDTITDFKYDTISNNLSQKEYINDIVSKINNRYQHQSSELSTLSNKIRNMNSNVNDNLLINGDFNIWQRGEELNINATHYVADRWICSYGTSAPKIVKKEYDGLTPMMHITSDGFNGFILSQYLHKDLSYGLLGKTLTLSFEIKGSITDKTGSELFARAQIGDSDFRDYSISHDWKKITITAEANTHRDYLHVRPFYVAYVPERGGDIMDVYIRNVKLEVGDRATEFIAPDYAEELNKCRYYYQRLTVSGPIVLDDNKTESTRAQFSIPYHVGPMRIEKPTVKFLTDGFIHVPGMSKIIKINKDKPALASEEAIWWGGEAQEYFGDQELWPTAGIIGTINGVDIYNNFISGSVTLEIDAEIYRS